MKNGIFILKDSLLTYESKYAVPYDLAVACFSIYQNLKTHVYTKPKHMWFTIAKPWEQP
jgi:hypothetical protein